MTDEATLAAILNGQNAVQAEVSRLSGVVGGLQAEVRQWKDLRLEARDDHAKCRAEVEQKFTDHIAVHVGIEDRLDPLETLRQQQAGGVKSAGLIWKGLVGFLGLVIMVLGILAYAGVT